MSERKIKVAHAALEHLDDHRVIGVGTGSTVNCFIQALAQVKHRIDACVASSFATEQRLRDVGISVVDLNVVGDLPLYFDGADEVNARREMIKGGGGALTKEKIIANVAEQFICMVDDTKVVHELGRFPIAVEVLALARSFVARELVQLGGDPVYRQGFVTDEGHIIIDVYHLNIECPIACEEAINRIPGVVENGLFAKRRANQVLVASDQGVTIF
jgi:ribose 5-phosphate isomerase A